mmetsp:Transcript_34732/g.107993  ORF Transcript_34732/g.107993 Transcript_34732/m.107993 type:complete len:321 (+) Transcript_34732:60-1022(+)
MKAWKVLFAAALAAGDAASTVAAAAAAAAGGAEDDGQRCAAAGARPGSVCASSLLQEGTRLRLRRKSLTGGGDITLEAPSTKLVVNSHVKYARPLGFLLGSMARAGFDRWSDVVVVVGGSERSVPPRRGSTILLPQLDRALLDRVIVVNSTLNAYDYTGLSVLYHYRDHPLIRADSYFYLLDSTSVGKDFPRLYAASSAGVRRDELRKPANICSNLCIFGRGLPYKWKDSYDVNFTKVEVLQLEVKGNCSVRGARPIVRWGYGDITELRERVWLGGGADPYHTGIHRDVFWYPDFDVKKYILMYGSGDVAQGSTVTYKPI